MMNIEDRLLSLKTSVGLEQLDKISAIYTDPKKVVPNSVFVALRGYQTDGHKYVASAIRNGASVLVVENDECMKDLDFKGLVCKVSSTRKILPVLLNEFYDFPSEKMFCIGITGTNGKTTVAQMISFILSQCGWLTGEIGTVRTGIIGNKMRKSFLTTPIAVELYSLLNEFYEAGVQATVMEASSIGLHQERVRGVDFNLGVFTNLTTDHLDYHKNMESYYFAKKKLFQSSHSSDRGHFIAILNFDDPMGVRLSREITTPFLSFGEKGATFSWKILSGNLLGTVFQLLFDKKKMEISLGIPGLYNVSNAVAALASVHTLGFSLERAVKLLSQFKGVRGRMERVSFDLKPQVFVDYAHTPNALEAVLSFLKQHLLKSCRLITVFGCGGERDQQKRPLMAQVAGRFSDLVILTSDNPRSEDPMEIMQDAMKGVGDKKKFILEIDRRSAIEQALDLATPEDVILIAGKGHETEQIVNNERKVFSDVEVAKEYLMKKSK